jgi:tripeptide aminopeptidase
MLVKKLEESRFMKNRKSMFYDLIDTDRLVDSFLKILKIKSPSKEERKLADYLKLKFKDLDIELSEDNAGEKIGSNTGNLIGRFANESQLKSPVKSIFLLAHLDTVVVNGEILPVVKNGRVINENKSCILGGDDKVAIAAIIEALEVIRENRIRTRDIDLVFTIAEEIAILGAKYLDIGMVKSKYGFVFDGEGDIGTIFNKAPYHNTFEITIKGKAAHSGAEPEKGISSIKAASDAISQLKPGRIDSDTTYNIGMINGGTAINIVPEQTVVRAEARSLVEEKLEKISGEIMEIFKKSVTGYGAKINIKSEREYNGFYIAEDEKCMEIAARALRNMGICPSVVSTGGGSDINILNARGKKALNLSSGMENIHTSKEYVKINQLINLAVLVIELATAAL